MHRDASAEQRGRQFIQRPIALNIAKQHRRPRKGRQRGEARLDKMPMLMNVADKNDGHVVPGRECPGYHGGMVTFRQQLHPPALAALTAYEALLRKWNATINLISAADLPLLWPRHIEDSLQLGSIAGPLPPRAIDLGSGAGFPGLILAIAFGIEMELIEQDQRKAAFLREAVMVTGATARVHAARIERVKCPPAPLVVARALAPLPLLLRLAAPLLNPDGICLFSKTLAVEPEITEAERHWSMRIDRIPSETDANGVILRIGELRPIG
jgi:16S rRNA (guanine527-N7)-methyltransferase